MVKRRSATRPVRRPMPAEPDIGGAGLNLLSFDQ
jgi:hypothetical protein